MNCSIEMDMQTPREGILANDQDRKTYNGIQGERGSLRATSSSNRDSDFGIEHFPNMQMDLRIIGRWTQVREGVRVTL